MVVNRIREVRMEQLPDVARQRAVNSPAITDNCKSAFARDKGVSDTHFSLTHRHRGQARSYHPFGLRAESTVTSNPRQRRQIPRQPQRLPNEHRFGFS
jgi:hypothetical protein